MLIGLCGPEGAGKSLAARLIAAQIPGAVIHPFAAPLKRMIEALGVDRKHLYGKPEEKAASLYLFGGRSARDAMQTLGTEWGRVCVDPEIWVRAWLASLPTAPAIADDLRFQNEADAIKSRGGRIICVVRSMRDFERVPRHASENFAAVPYDCVVLNDKCPTILGQRLAEALGAVPA